LNTVAAVTTLTGVSIAAIYPLGLWCQRKIAVAGLYYQQLMVAALAGVVGVALLWLHDTGFHLRLSGIIWLMALFSTIAFYWNRNRVHPWIISIPSVFGLIVFYKVSAILLYSSELLFIIQILTTGILGLFFLLLGDVKKIKDSTELAMIIRPLVTMLFLLLTARAVWIGYSIIWGQFTLVPEMLNWLDYITKMQGYLPVFATLFGVVLPTLSLFLIISQIKRGYRRSAELLLYPLVLSVLLAEIIFRFYLYQYGIIL